MQHLKFIFSTSLPVSAESFFVLTKFPFHNILLAAMIGRKWNRARIQTAPSIGSAICQPLCKSEWKDFLPNFLGLAYPKWLKCKGKVKICMKNVRIWNFVKTMQGWIQGSFSFLLFHLGCNFLGLYTQKQKVLLSFFSIFRNTLSH